MTSLTLELSRDDIDGKAQLETLGSENVVFATPDHFEGDVHVITAIVTVTTATVGALATIIKARIAARQHIKVKIRGIEVSGADLKDVERFLDSLDADNKQ
jgi:hypothetical protein